METNTNTERTPEQLMQVADELLDHIDRRLNDQLCLDHDDWHEVVSQVINNLQAQTEGMYR